MDCANRDKARVGCWGDQLGSAAAYEMHSQMSTMDTNIQTLMTKFDAVGALVAKMERATTEILRHLTRSNGQETALQELHEKMDPLTASIGNIQKQNATLLEAMAMASGRVENVITTQQTLQRITYEKGLPVESPQNMQFKHELQEEFKSFMDTLQTTFTDQEKRLTKQIQEQPAWCRTPSTPPFDKDNQELVVDVRGARPKALARSQLAVEEYVEAQAQKMTEEETSRPHDVSNRGPSAAVLPKTESGDDDPRPLSLPCEKPQPPPPIDEPQVPETPLKTVGANVPLATADEGTDRNLTHESNFQPVVSFQPWACTVCKTVNLSPHKPCHACNSPNRTTTKQDQLLHKASSGLELEDTDHKIQLLEDQSFAAVFVHESNPQKPIYLIEEHYKKTGIAQALARSRVFHNSTVTVVALNALWIGLETELTDKPNIFDAPPLVLIVSMAFVLFFVSEWLVRFFAFKRPRDAFKDGWFRFDTFLVVTMVLDYFVLNVVFKVMGSGDDKHAMPMPAAPLRTLRLLKLTRMARLMRAFPELVTMVKGLFRSLRATTTTIGLLAVMDYIFAIVLYLLLKDEAEFNSKIQSLYGLNFQTLWKAMWLLAMNGILLLDNSSPILTEMLFHDTSFAVVVAALVLIIFTVFAALLVLNMLIGILCDLVSKVTTEQRDAAAINCVRQELLSKIKEFDNGDGYISHAELMTLLGDSKAQAVFKHLQISELFMLQMVEMLYRTTNRVTIASCLDLMLMCRSKNNATVELLAGGFGFLAKQVDSLRQQLPKRKAEIKDYSAAI